MKPTDGQFMRRALSLAARGKGRVSPNPCVGCVIVKNGRIVGEGFHEYFGGPHAEIAALKKAGARARGATLYVTLEPCSHWGKTPPCAPEVARSGVRRVVAAMSDPNPLVSGRGRSLLRRAGIRVDVGLERPAAEFLNRSFLTYITKRRPHVLLKTAMTLDGKIATARGDSRWVSGPESRRLVHRLRAESDAVAVGATTAERDNPALTSHGEGRDPLRVVIDPTLRTRPTLKMFSDDRRPPVIVAGGAASRAREARLVKKGARVLRVRESKGGLDLGEALASLAKMEVGQLLLEGGGETAWNFLKAGFVDEVMSFIAPKLLGGRTAVTPVGGDGFSAMSKARPLEILSLTRVGDDIVVHALAGQRRKR
ncbi:MAG: bifunctional diaminohydroxyphosphoribosylaminopyrimidine deaminase/5-amino-6-(5-phosphoribosylamino)uracil reductase RibD [Elusimicrobia bacterium]|nr:bifunctional diaminohydroxyphosphoribosylaminopyrimidine deaminase/5-amino-6-(5-phosphoribosylamino)uracil reductase RibD [Elusimicrobiota bacterium]